MDKDLKQIAIEFSNGVIRNPSKEEPIPANLNKDIPIKKSRGRKSLKDSERDNELIEVPEDEVLFQKQYYSIGEVAYMFKVNNSLIRYWEKEFDILEPRKNRKGDRFFKPSDIKNLQLIHDLLRRRKFTMEGAKDFIKKTKQGKEKHELIQSLQQLKSFLLELKANL